MSCNTVAEASFQATVNLINLSTLATLCPHGVWVE